MRPDQCVLDLVVEPKDADLSEIQMPGVRPSAGRLFSEEDARDPTQAVPLSGTYIGAPADFLDMRIEVTVSAQ